MPNPYGQFVPDSLSPSGYRWQRHGEQPATAMLPTVPPAPRIEIHEDERMHIYPREHDGPEHPGGDWANADAYLSYDDVDSRTVIDTGAP